MLRKRARSNTKNQEKVQITKLDDDVSSNTTANLQHPDYISGKNQNQKPSPNFFNVPGLILGMTPKCVLDCDSIRSPTSPLDFKIFTNLGSSSFGFPKHDLHCHHHHKCWECSSKVGLGILDSLSYDESCGGKTVKSLSNGKRNILFGLQIRNKNLNPNLEPPLQLIKVPPQSPNSLLNNNSPALYTPRPMKSSHRKTEVFFQIGEDVLEPEPTQSFSVDSGSSYVHHRLADHRRASFGTTNKRSCLVNEPIHQAILDSEIPPLIPDESNNGSHHQPLLSAGIELSEDYTCVITRGPNPKTTHIYGDCILEGHQAHSISRTDSGAASDMQTNVTTTPLLELRKPSSSSSPSENFLSFCHFCNKKLEEGKDIYMYRGEKAFCSFDCRSEEILIEEGKEKISSSHEAAQAPNRSLEPDGIEEEEAEYDDII